MSRSSRLLILAGSIVIAIGLTVIVGWLCHVTALTTFGSAGAPMALSTSAGMIAAGLGYIAAGSGWPKMARLFSAVVAAFGIWMWVRHFSAADAAPGIFQPDSGAVSERMNLFIGAAFILISVLLTVLLRKKTRREVAVVLCGGLLLLALFPLFGYVALNPTIATASYLDGSLPTALALMVLAVGSLGWSASTHGEAGVTSSLIAAALAVFIAIGAVTMQSVAQLRISNIWVTHTLEVEIGIEHLVGVLSRMDASTRSFALTGTERFVDRIESHKEEARKDLDFLARLTVDNPNQQERLRKLKPLVERKFAASDAIKHARQDQGLAASALLVETTSAEASQGIVGIIQELRDEEKSLFAVRAHTARQTEYDVKKIQLMGGAVGIGLIGLAFWLARKAADAQKIAAVAMAGARDQALEASRLKSEFLANMSHEIRTPMNGVIGMTSLLADSPMSPEQREYLETIRVSGETLLVLIGDILDFSKIESGKIELEEQEFDIVACVEETLLLFKAKAQEKRIELMYLIDPSVPQAVVGDVTRIRQIIANLLSNALKFTAQGEIEVSVRCGAARSDSKCTLVVSVRDTGIGIPDDKRYRLFQPFTQVDASTTRRFGGTGLGLTISKRLCELMGGAMEVESTAGKGSVFRFTVQVGVVAVRRSISVAPFASPLSGKRVLIVDDSATNRKIISHYLEVWKMIPVLADGPEAALRCVEAGHFDLCLVDMHMPGGDGLELTREIRARPNHEKVSVIILTSEGRSDIQNTAAKWGVVAVLDKPVRQSVLFRAISEALGGALPTKVASIVAASREIAAMPAIKILLAEDNSVNQIVAQRMLGKLGYRPDTVADGQEVVQAILRQHYDVVLMDVQMPNLDGLQATELIRANPGIKQPWIIAMTANAIIGDREHCLAAGMNDYVSKPVKIEELRAVLLRSQEPVPAIDEHRGTAG